MISIRLPRDGASQQVTQALNAYSPGLANCLRLGTSSATKGASVTLRSELPHEADPAKGALVVLEDGVRADVCGGAFHSESRVDYACSASGIFVCWPIHVCLP